MGTRPLTDEEKTDIERCLQAAKEQKRMLDGYVAELEKRLQDGTTWCYEPQAFKQMCVDVEEKCQKWKEESDQREIALYGHILTQRERDGWLPARVKAIPTE